LREKRVLDSLSRRSLWSVAACAAIATIARPRPAAAHARIQESQPPIGGSVRAGHVVLVFRYNSRIDRGRSRLTLNRPDRTQTVLTIDPEGPPDVLSAAVDLAPGDYVVRWQVLAVDGHITRGDVPFTATGP
jgi:hypothetical protein